MFSVKHEKLPFSLGALQGVASGSEKLPASILAEGLVIVGSLSSTGEIHIESSVKGDIRGATIVIGESGLVHGEIGGESVTVRGEVNGNIVAQNVHLESSSRVIGTIGQRTLSIKPGAHFEGRCHNFGSPHAGGPKPDAQARGEPAEALTSGTKPAGANLVLKSKTRRLPSSAILGER